MKYLITRSSSKQAAESLRCALAMQKKFPIRGIDFEELIITDAKINGIDVPQSIHPEISGHGGYWHGRVRNLVFQAARARKVDYVIALDSDAVFLGLKTPPSLFGCFTVFHQKEGEELAAEKLSDATRWICNSWWIFERSMLERPEIVSHEGFIGYGWDDYDFLFNVARPNGVEFQANDATAIHLFHPPQRGMDNEVFATEFLRNKRLFKARYRDRHGHDWAEETPPLSTSED